MTGYFEFLTPIYFIRDPELLKQVAIKDFESFEDHKFVLEPEMCSLMGNTMFMMKGQKWRDMRATLSPTFTGAKIKQMFDLIREVAIDAKTFMLNDAPENGVKQYDMYLLSSKLANDVIASCAFGLRINSIEDDQNEFFKIGQTFEHLGSFEKSMRVVIKTIFPGITKAIGYEFLEQHIKEFFRRLMRTNMEERRRKGINRPDVIDMLMKAKDKADSYIASGKANELTGPEAEVIHWTEMEMVAQCFVFFLGGFDSITWVLCAATYRIVENPEVQVKLLEDVDKLKEKLNGRELIYDDLKELKYVDQFLGELLRLDGGVFVERKCTKEYFMEETNQTIPKDAWIISPSSAFHRDPEYFPDPEKFDPERFNEDNIHTINQDTYLPFGTGPRACVGQRFALVELKVILFYMLANFTYEKCENTLPLNAHTSFFGFKPTRPFYLNLRARTL